MEALRKQAARILQEKKKHKLWLTVFLCMAALVTAGTVTALKMSGQALSHKEKVLTCGIEVHQHTEQCHDSEGNLVCGQADYVVHVHNDDCRDKDGNLVCTLPEIEPHEHDAECFEEEKRLVCTKEESAGHQHDESCYTKVRGELICGMEGTGHQHGAECYTKVQGELICASEEEGHEHTDECYEWIEELTCGQTEEVHEHTDECYKWTEELNCEILEGEGAHTHTDECYETETVNTCGKLELHTHEDSCYDEDGNLICGQTELLEHVHADDCFEIIEIEVSDQESGASEESGEEDAGTEESGGESGEPEADGEDEETQLFHKTYEDAEIRVVAEYDESANIPEEAQLVAERIEAAAEDDAQDDPETAGPKTDDAQGTDSADETQEPQEIVTEEVPYRLRFLIDEEEVQPEGTVTFTVQGLDENGNDAGGPVVAVYNAGDELDSMVATLIRETVAEAQHEFRKEAQDGSVHVAAEYDTTANIPEDAELLVRQITAESDAEYYAQCEAEYLEQTAGNAAMDMLFEIGFYVEEARIEPEAPVSITVQIPGGPMEEDEAIHVIRFGEIQAEELDADVSADEAGNLSAGFEDSSLSTYAVGKTESKTFGVKKECRNDALNIIVLAEYNLDAEIPEDAELKVEAITPESNPEYYAQREAEYLEQVGEGAQMDMLLNIGFYDADGTEIEPKTPVSITVQLLDSQYEDGEQIKVVHFGNEATEELDASEIRTDEAGNKATSFETDSFSDFGVGLRNGENQLVYCSEDRGTDYGMDGITTFALGRSGSGVVLEKGSSYQIYCESGNKIYALYHNENNEVKAVEVTVDTNGVIVVPGGYTQEGFLWNYDTRGEGAALKYSSGNKIYYLWDDPINSQNWSMTDLFEFMDLQFSGDSNDAISVYSLAGSSYLNFSDGQIVAGKTSDSTHWKFVKPSLGTYKVNYYKNEVSIDNYYFQTEPMNNTAKGTLLGSMELTPVETSDGKEVIRIPLKGKVGNNDIEVLPDYTSGGNTYKFYGWSLHSNSNYQPDIGHLIYCGYPVEINGCVVSSYVADGVITLDVTEIPGSEIDLYAIWAAPSHVEGMEGVEYYGTNYNKLSGLTDAERAGRGVMFFVRLDGQIPNEPGSEVDTSEGGILNRANYTEYVFAKDESGKVMRQPLKYWMHIYGVQNGDAVEANLAYKPTDEDLLARIKEKDGFIKVAGQIVDFSEMTVEEFRENYYIAWYVCKDGREKDCWHIDGVLLKKTEQWNLVYADNGITGGTIIPVAQYAYGGLATIHNTLVGGETFLQSDIPPEKTGYTFAGWNTDPNGNGTWFTAGEYQSETGTEEADFIDNNTITVEVITEGENAGKGQVYKDGEEVKGLFATKKANGIFEVVLYPQWENGTNSLIVTKTDSATGMLLKDVKFRLYECKLENGELQKDESKAELTAAGGSATNANGKLTIRQLKNNTYYCLEETYANGYERRNKVYFKVIPEENSAMMSISILNVDGTSKERPDWLQTQYSNDSTSGTGGLAGINFTITDEEILQNVTFKKTDETGQALGGAQFRLSKADEAGNYAELGISTLSDKENDGIFIFENLSALSYGEYKLEEIMPPTGYRSTVVYFEIKDPVDSGEYQKGMVVKKVEVDGEEISFTASEFPVVATETTTPAQANGQNVSSTRYSYELSIQNKKGSQKVALQKKGDDGAESLTDAVFSLYKGPEQKKEDLVNSNITFGQDNKYSIGELGCGEYYLFEDKEPNGYIRLTEPIKITVTTTGVTAVKASGETVSVITPDTSKGETAYVVEVFNSKGIALPETGGPGTVMYTLGGLAVIATSLMYGLGMRRKKEKGGQH